MHRLRGSRPNQTLERHLRSHKLFRFARASGLRHFIAEQARALLGIARDSRPG